MDVNEEEDIIDDFLYAARAGDEELLVELLSSRPDLVGSTDSNGNTPLHLSSANGHNDIIKLLLKYPQSISPQNAAGNTPLHWACLNNHVDTVKLLVQEGADMYVKNNAGKDAIWETQQRGNEELIAWMLARGEERVMGQVTEEEVEDVEGEGDDETNEKEKEISDEERLIKGDAMEKK